MKTIATIQCDSEAEAIEAAHTTTIDEMTAQMGEKLPSGSYLYVNTKNQIEAATVGRDASPADEVFFIGRTR